MKKKISLISLLVGIVFLVGGSIILSSCEGPAGAAGTNGVDGNVTCMECHSEDAIQIINEQFAQSVHRAGQIAVDYAGSRSSCAACHSSEGFIEYARTGDVAEKHHCAQCMGMQNLS